MSSLSLSSLKQTLASQAGFLLIAVVSGYGFAYLYLILMGQFLGPEQYGILGALFAIFYIALLIGQSLREAIATKVAEIKAIDGEAVAISTFIRLGIKLTLLCIVPCLAFIVAAQPIANFFHVTGIGPIIILALAILAALVLDIIMGLQQGLQKFRDLGITGYTVSQGLKAVLGFIFVWVGWELMGAVGALFASTAIAIVVGLILGRKQLAGSIREKSESSTGLLPIVLPTLILAVFLSIPGSVDVILVTHYIGGDEAGLYNAVATIGKVVIFMPMAVSFVLLPRVTERHALGQNTRDILLQSLGIALFLSGSVVLVCWAFPELVIKIFFGEEYIGAMDLLGWYTLAMLFFSLDSVLIHYSLAIRNMWLMILADVVTVIEVVAIILAHQSLNQIIWILLYSNLLILLISAPYLIFRGVRQHGN